MKYYSKRGSQTFSRIKHRTSPSNNSSNQFCTSDNKRFFQRTHHHQFTKKKNFSPSSAFNRTTKIRRTSCVANDSPTEILANEGKGAPLLFSSLCGASPYFYFNTEKDENSVESYYTPSSLNFSFDDSEEILDLNYKPLKSTLSKSTKVDNDHPKRVKLESGAFVVPHPSKAYKGGEDAHFVTENVLGVADGVGGWADSGIDPALYANKLMQGARRALDEQQNLTPLQILQEGYNFAQDVVGSSTACVVSIEGSILKAANLGDSGFMIIRDNKVFLKSKEQQHSFNFPFQLGTGSTSTPEHSDIYEIEVKVGDIIVLGSDGLFDNLFEAEMLNVLQQELLEGDPQLMAQELALTASKLAHQQDRISPFAAAAQQANLYFLGGKVDDITVIVGKVSSDELTEPNSPASQQAVV